MVTVFECDTRNIPKCIMSYLLFALSFGTVITVIITLWLIYSMRGMIGYFAQRTYILLLALLEVLLVALHYSVVPVGPPSAIAVVFQEFLKYMLFFYLCYFYMIQGSQLLSNNHRTVCILNVFFSFNIIFLVFACLIGIWTGSKENDEFCYNAMWIVLKFTSFVLTFASLTSALWLTNVLKRRSRNYSLTMMAGF